MRQARHYVVAVTQAVVGPAEIALAETPAGPRPLVALTVGDTLPGALVPAEVSDARPGERILFDLTEEEWKRVRYRLPRPVVTATGSVAAPLGFALRGTLAGARAEAPGAVFRVDEEDGEPEPDAGKSSEDEEPKE